MILKKCGRDGQGETEAEQERIDRRSAMAMTNIGMASRSLTPRSEARLNLNRSKLCSLASSES